jgi:mono/diheme cytochrome c family protein
MNLLFALLFTFVANAASIEPELILKVDNKTIRYSRNQLLQRKDITTLRIDYDPTYPGKKMVYKAIPVASLLDPATVPADATLQFLCLDGFSASMDVGRVMNKNKDQAVAYLAIEEKKKKWPPIKSPVDQHSAGPFYLVWVNPKASNIGQEEWPFQLVGFEVRPPLRATNPAIFPAEGIGPDHAISRGFGVFKKNCFTCHTMNLQGEAKLGPDLNVPMSPIEYFKEDALKALIRNPQSVRAWPLSKMSAFPKDVISDQEMDDLMDYLKHMVGRRAK